MKRPVMLSGMSIMARAWYRSNTFSHSAFPVERLADARSASVSVCLPARNEARTIGPIVSELMELRAHGVVDQVVVVDQSSDGTALIAHRLGAEVHDVESLMPALGPVLGKGDAMWRSLSVLDGDVICFLDADSGEFGAHFVCGLLGPLLCEPGLSFVKGFYRRPFRVGETVYPEGGGRVTELVARPLLNLFYPELAAVQQPLAGEIAAPRELLARLPFATGYGVDIALLLDAYREVGLDRLAQVDLEVRQNAHQPLRELGPMAHAVLQTVAARLEQEGRLRGPLPVGFTGPVEGPFDLPVTVARPVVERPPHETLRAVA